MRVLRVPRLTGVTGVTGVIDVRVTGVMVVIDEKCRLLEDYIRVYYYCVCVCVN